jgi:hypothetical protein
LVQYSLGKQWHRSKPVGEAMHYEDNGCGEKKKRFTSSLKICPRSAGKRVYNEHVVVAQRAHRLMIEIEGHSSFIHRFQNRLGGGGGGMG